MNRWRQRLAELSGRSDTAADRAFAVWDGVGAEQAPAPPFAVQNVQNPAPVPTFEHFEHFEQRTENAAAVDKTPKISDASVGWGGSEEGRAAIVEHDGRAPRAWAWVEGVARLDPGRPPGDVPTKRWQRLVVDADRFLDGGWAEKAAALGWGPFDLFCCDRDMPFARIDQQGLLWLLNSDRLVPGSSAA